VVVRGVGWVAGKEAYPDQTINIILKCYYHQV